MTDKPAATPPSNTTSSIEDQIRLREGKASDLRSKGVDPWGNGTKVENGEGMRFHPNQYGHAAIALEMVAAL